jgi:hypothetical protein
MRIASGSQNDVAAVAPEPLTPANDTVEGDRPSGKWVSGLTWIWGVLVFGGGAVIKLGLPPGRHPAVSPTALTAALSLIALAIGSGLGLSQVVNQSQPRAKDGDLVALSVVYVGLSAALPVIDTIRDQHWYIWWPIAGITLAVLGFVLWWSVQAGKASRP